MIPRIREIEPRENYKLFICFDNDSKVLYDVKDDIEHIDAFKPLMSMPGLFNSVRLDESRTCVYWNDEIDLPSDTLLEYGERV